MDEKKKVYLINSCSIFDVDLPKIKHIENTLNIHWKVPFKGEKYHENTLRWNMIVDMIRDRFPQVSIIDLTTYIPDDGMIDGKPIILDTNHWNVYGAKKIAEQFIKDGKRLIREEDLK